MVCWKHPNRRRGPSAVLSSSGVASPEGSFWFPAPGGTQPLRRVKVAARGEVPGTANCAAHLGSKYDTMSSLPFFLVVGRTLSFANRGTHAKD